jgi:hypothetical protein
MSPDRRGVAEDAPEKRTIAKKKKVAEKGFAEKEDAKKNVAKKEVAKKKAAKTRCTSLGKSVGALNLGSISASDGRFAGVL